VRALPPRHPLLDHRPDLPPLFIDHLHEPVAGVLAPGGHILVDAGIVAHDFQEIAGAEILHLPGGEEDRHGTEEADDVERLAGRHQAGTAAGRRG
jgi:hypothetical protein